MNICEKGMQKERVGITAAIEDLGEIVENLCGAVDALNKRLLPIKREVITELSYGPVSDSEISSDSEIASALKKISTSVVSISNSIVNICNAIDL